MRNCRFNLITQTAEPELSLFEWYFSFFFLQMARSSLLFLLTVITRASLNEALVRNCTAECNCKEIVGEEGLISANCTISNLTELSTFIRPSQVKTL